MFNYVLGQAEISSSTPRGGVNRLSRVQRYEDESSPEIVITPGTYVPAKLPWGRVTPPRIYDKGCIIGEGGCVTWRGGLQTTSVLHCRCS